MMTFPMTESPETPRQIAEGYTTGEYVKVLESKITAYGNRRVRDALKKAGVKI